LDNVRSIRTRLTKDGGEKKRNKIRILIPKVLGKVRHVYKGRTTINATYKRSLEKKKGKIQDEDGVGSR